MGSWYRKQLSRVKFRSNRSKFKDRYNHVKLENDLIDSIIDKPELNEWYWNFEKVNIVDKRGFQKEFQ